MVTGNDYPPTWAVLPGSSVTAELTTGNWTRKPVLELCGNRQGFVSLGNLLLWVAMQSETESLSVTGLPFVHAQSAVSLTVVQTMAEDGSGATLVRTDKDRQFQWLMDSETLQIEAINVIDLGLSAWFYPEGNDFHGSVGPESEYELFFWRRDRR